MNWLPQGLAEFGPATLAAMIIGGYLVLGEPFVGWVLHRRFEAAVDVFSGARRWLYVRLLVLEWGLVALVAAVALVAPGVGPAELGLRWPDRVGALSGAVVLLILVITVTSVRTLRSGVLRRPGQESTTLRSVGALLPRTDRDRRLFAAVAATAGIAEEVVYRGFGIGLLAALYPVLPWWALIAAAGAGFGIAHSYQGVAGLLTTGLLGAVLAAVYLDTGSLLMPILLHALIDLRFLAVPANALPDGGADQANTPAEPSATEGSPDEGGTDLGPGR